MSSFLKERKKRILPIILVSLALTIVVFVEAPLEIYSSNLGEMLFSLGDFLPCSLMLWLLCSAACGMVLFFLPEKLYRVACPLAAAGAVLLFLQGTYLNLGINSLPGDNLTSETISTGGAVLNAGIWIAVIALTVALALVKKGSLSPYVSILLSVMVIGIQLTNIVFIFLTTDGITVKRQERWQEDADYTPKALVSDGLTELGEDGNIVVFIVDRFDETFAEGALEKDPGVYDELTGFTWFQDEISLYPHTFPSVPWMLTNKSYSCDMDRESYLMTAYEGDTPLARLHEAGYTIDLFTQSFYAFCDENDLPDYVDNVVPNDTFRDLAIIYKMGTAAKMTRAALYRCLPFAMKGLVGQVDSDFSEYYRHGTRPENTYSPVDMKDIFDLLNASDFTVRPGKKYSFIHYSGCHDFLYDMDWKNPPKSEAHDRVLSARVSFKIIDRYLQQMKSLGVYDDATIIITGDHAEAHNSGVALKEPRLTALFVKPAGSGSGPLKISHAQVSNEQLWATVFQAEGLDGTDYGQSMFDVPEDVDQTRRNCWITWKTPMDVYEYEVTGPGSDFSNWKIVEHEVLDKFPTD